MNTIYTLLGFIAGASITFIVLFYDEIVFCISAILDERVPKDGFDTYKH